MALNMLDATTKSVDQNVKQVRRRSCVGVIPAAGVIRCLLEIVTLQLTTFHQPLRRGIPLFGQYAVSPNSLLHVSLFLIVVLTNLRVFIATGHGLKHKAAMCRATIAIIIALAQYFGTDNSYAE